MMMGRIFAGLFLCALFIVGGDAQSPDPVEIPVWTVEFLKVRPENFALAMGYLDDHWMPVRAEAKRQGVVLEYHRIHSAVLMIPGHKAVYPNSIVLLTKYKNSASMEEPTNTAGVIKLRSAEVLFETLTTQIFLEEPGASRGFKFHIIE